MKKHLIILAAMVALTTYAQGDKRPFHARLFNSEYAVAMTINFYDQDIVIPGQELFGQMAGYLSKEGTTYCWLIVEAKTTPQRARLQLSNDYGSEDLEAELTVEGDSLYTLKQLNGSTLKVPNKGKWQKLPRTMLFRRIK